MQNVLQSRHYNINEKEQGNYLVQTRSQAKSSGIILPEVHGIGKRIYPNLRLEKQVIKPVITPEAKGISQVKPRLRQGEESVKWKTFGFPMSQPLDKPKQTKIITR